MTKHFLQLLLGRKSLNAFPRETRSGVKSNDDSQKTIKSSRREMNKMNLQTNHQSYAGKTREKNGMNVKRRGWFSPAFHLNLSCSTQFKYEILPMVLHVAQKAFTEKPQNKV